MSRSAKNRHPVPMQAHHISSVVKSASAMVNKTIPAMIDNVFVMIVVVLWLFVVDDFVSHIVIGMAVSVTALTHPLAVLVYIVRSASNAFGDANADAPCGVLVATLLVNLVE